MADLLTDLLKEEPAEEYECLTDEEARDFYGAVKEHPLENKELSPPRNSVEKPIHRAIAIMTAQGMSLSEIVTNTGMAAVTISQLQKKPWFVDRVLTIQSSKALRVEDRLQKMASVAAEELYRLCTTGKSERVRLSASTDILDRALGRAVQRTENYNASASELADLDMSEGELERLRDRYKEIHALRDKIRQGRKEAKESVKDDSDPLA
jgi:hypothetical protein